MSSGFRATRAGVASAVADGSRPRASQTSSNTVSSGASAAMRTECTLPPLAKCSVTDSEAGDTGATGKIDGDSVAREEATKAIEEVVCEACK